MSCYTFTLELNGQTFHVEILYAPDDGEDHAEAEVTDISSNMAQLVWAWQEQHRLETYAAAERDLIQHLYERCKKRWKEEYDDRDEKDAQSEDV